MNYKRKFPKGTNVSNKLKSDGQIYQIHKVEEPHPGCNFATCFFLDDNGEKVQNIISKYNKRKESGPSYKTILIRCINLEKA